MVIVVSLSLIHTHTHTHTQLQRLLQFLPINKYMLLQWSSPPFSFSGMYQKNGLGLNGFRVPKSERWIALT